MKFTIEVNDFWLEEEELSTALTSHIKREVILDISKSIKDQVETAISKQVDSRIKEKIDPLIDSTLSDLIEAGVITRSNKEISIKAHIKSVFMNSTGWNRPDTTIASIAKKFGEEMRLQYNSVFAAQIVENMRQQGFLKDGISKLLLDDKSN